VRLACQLLQLTQAPLHFGDDVGALLLISFGFLRVADHHKAPLGSAAFLTFPPAMRRAVPS
jgi:hypothetical protein